MKRVAHLKAALKKLAHFDLGEAGVHRGPLRRELGAAIEAPIAKHPGDLAADSLRSEVLEQPAAHHFAVLFVDDSHAPHHLSDPILPS